MRRLFILTFALAICLTPSFAQKKKTKVAKPAEKKVVVAEKTPQEKLFEELLPSTAKIMFIDSVVVDKASFLSQLPVSSDMGKISITKERTSYTNEFGNTCIYASGDSINRHLYIQHRYGENWDEPSQLTELNQEEADFPFLMTDGVTLYFSAEGEGTVGGRDIFRSTYDADGAHFYEATNMGMPFNSPANEYFLAISDMDNIGWLVSDRYQSEGKVCIYTFEPTAQRKTFDEDTDNAILKHYAGIKWIKDTWQFGDRDAALKRRDALLARMKSTQSNERVEFVVNDQTIYTSLSDFKSANGATKYQEIKASKSKLTQLQSLLDSLRDQYADAPSKKKYELGRQINSLEKEVYALELKLAAEEKSLRNSENK